MQTHRGSRNEVETPRSNIWFPNGFLPSSASFLLLSPVLTFFLFKPQSEMRHASESLNTFSPVKEAGECLLLLFLHKNKQPAQTK